MGNVRCRVWGFGIRVWGRHGDKFGVRIPLDDFRQAALPQQVQITFTILSSQHCIIQKGHLIKVRILQ